MAQQNAYIEIVEQPKPTALRFRYITESRKAGSIVGEHSNKTSQSYPAIKVYNYSGPLVAKMFCVTEQGHLHPHKLVGPNCPEDHGVCIIRFHDALPDSIIRFSNVGIQCSKRDDIRAYLDAKKNVLPECSEPPNANTIDLTCVRLMFKVYVGRDLLPLDPVVSRAIYDKKHCCDLTITRLSIQSAPAKGGAELFILCNKVKKEDLQVVFADELWQDYGTFLPSDVFKECVVICKVPSYRCKDIKRPVGVKLFLRQPSTQEVGNELQFTYIPVDPDPYHIEKKRKKMADHPQMGMSFGHASTFNHPQGSFPTFPDVVLHHDATQIGSHQPMFAEDSGVSKAANWSGIFHNVDTLRSRYSYQQQFQQQQQTPSRATTQVSGPDIFGRENRNTTLRFCGQPQMQHHRDPSNPFDFAPNPVAAASQVPLHVEEVNIRTQAGSGGEELGVFHHVASGASRLPHTSTLPQFVEIKSESNIDFDNFLFGGQKPVTVRTKTVPSNAFEQIIPHNTNPQNTNITMHMEHKQDLPNFSDTLQSFFAGLPQHTVHTGFQAPDHNNMQFSSAIRSNQMFPSTVMQNQANTQISHANPLLAPVSFEQEPNEIESLIFPELGENFYSLTLEDMAAFADEFISS